MLLIAIMSVAVAVPPAGFKETKKTKHCTLFSADTTPSGEVPMRAECYWPDIEPAVLHELFSDWAAYDDYLGVVELSEVVRREGDATWTHQVHHLKGLASRECTIKNQRRDLDGGGARYAWTLDNGDMQAAPGNVTVTRNDGYWEVIPSPDGGSLVNHEMTYNPAASVPGFIIRWFQTSGLATTVSEMEAAARNQSR